MRRQRLEFRVTQRGAVMQRIDRRDQGLLGRRPAGRIGAALHRGADLLLGEVRGRRECCDMHAPFVLASGQRAGPVDDDFAVPQRQRPAIEQAAGPEFLPGAGVAGDHAEQDQRRRAAHDPVKLLLKFRRIGRLQRCQS